MSLQCAAMEQNHGGEEESCFTSEAKRQLRLAWPLVVGCLLQKLIQMISIMFAGHLGEVALASASLATSFAGVTGFSLLTGMASSLDTLCGQAFGAEQHHLLGVYKQRAMVVLALVSVPVAMAWAYTDKILLALLLRQEDTAEIAAGAGSYTRWMIPAVFLFGQLQCHVRFLQAQNVVVPVMLSSGATVLVHVPICWVLVHSIGMGVNGAALANAVSNLFNLSFLALYVRLSPSCKPTWTGFSSEAFCGIPGFLKLAVPSALMVCMEWWSFEILVLLSGLLPNPKLETAVLSICFNTYSFAFSVPMGLGAAASIRVSNELGAGRVQAARIATRVVMLLAFSLGISEGLVMLLARKLLGYAFSNVEEVVLYTARMMPILAVCFLFDSVQCVLSGVVRGCGKQKIGAFINLVAYYIVGTPAASIFAFIGHLKGVGLLFGILCGLVVHLLLLLTITLCANWNKEALKANDRVPHRTASPIETRTSGTTKQEDGCASVATDNTHGTIEATKGPFDPSKS